jgi:hypothetical protein
VEKRARSSPRMPILRSARRVEDESCQIPRRNKSRPSAAPAPTPRWRRCFQRWPPSPVAVPEKPRHCCELNLAAAHSFPNEETVSINPIRGWFVLPKDDRHTLKCDGVFSWCCPRLFSRLVGMQAPDADVELCGGALLQCQNAHVRDPHAAMRILGAGGSDIPEEAEAIQSISLWDKYLESRLGVFLGGLLEFPGVSKFHTRSREIIRNATTLADDKSDDALQIGCCAWKASCQVICHNSQSQSGPGLALLETPANTQRQDDTTVRC